MVSSCPAYTRPEIRLNTKPLVLAAESTGSELSTEAFSTKVLDSRDGVRREVALKGDMKSNHVPQTLEPSSLEIFRLALDRKRSELIHDWIHAEEIAAARFPDTMDEVVSANQRDVAVDLLNRKTLLLVQVSDALQRLASGSYGVCLECAGPIPLKRLCALPWAALCLSCQEHADRERFVVTTPAVFEPRTNAA